MKKRIGCPACSEEIKALKAAIIDRDSQIRELWKMVANLQYAATRDGLTGLLRRGEAELSLLRTLRGAQPGERNQIACMLIDIDFFKQVNDTHGHPVGDLVIKRVADILRNSTFDIDTLARSRSYTEPKKNGRRDEDRNSVGRHGGEEFLSIYVDVGDSTKKAESIRQSVAVTRLRGFPNLSITVSIGIAEMIVEGGMVTKRQLSTLVKRADTALYAAKRGGRNRVVHFRDLVTNQAAA